MASGGIGVAIQDTGWWETGGMESPPVLVRRLARRGGGGVVAERDRGATVERAVVEPIAPGGGSRLSTVGEGISQGGGRDDGGQTIPRGSRQ